LYAHSPLKKYLIDTNAKCRFATNETPFPLSIQLKIIEIVSMIRTLLFLLLFSGGYIANSQTSTPNIVLIFLDDVGNGDLSATGALSYRTPVIDQLASDGLRFTNYLAVQAVCSASRAGLLTGCYPNRIGFSGALSPNSKVGIHADEMTMGELLKQKGYATAIVGKWHLGDGLPFLPKQNGFDEYFGIPYSNDMWPVDYDGKPVAPGERKSHYPPLFIYDGNDKAIPIRTLDDQATITSRYTEKAVSFIRRNNKKPFFLYLAHTMAHVPINASKPFRGTSKQGLYGDVMMEIDWSVGEVMKVLREEGLEENTLVIFTSDNGPWLNYGNHAGSTGGLREGKGTSYEGGQRVPCIFYWKDRIASGKISNSLVASIDIFPTIASLVGAGLPTKKIDGVSLMPIINGDFDAEPRKEFYYYYRRNNLEAVRRGDWKLVLPHPGRTYLKFPVGNDGHPGQVDENSPAGKALYDLRRDPGERYDVQSEYPEIVKSLELLADLAREDLGDELSDRPGKNRRPSGVLE
jgi:arylsulfatase